MTTATDTRILDDIHTAMTATPETMDHGLSYAELFESTGHPSFRVARLLTADSRFETAPVDAEDNGWARSNVWSFTRAHVVELLTAV